jgi:hypothetical protein
VGCGLELWRLRTDGANGPTPRAMRTQGTCSRTTPRSKAPPNQLSLVALEGVECVRCCSCACRRLGIIE